MTDKELQEFEDWARKAIEASKFEAMPQVEFPEAVLKLATEVRRLKQEKQDLWDELCHLEELAGMTE